MLTTTIRAMTRDDADAVAALHTSSWQSAYRGILTDAYLDTDVESERHGAWRDKLASLTDDEFGVLAMHDDRLIGFGFVRMHDDRVWGALIDNLHVHPEYKGRGVGRQLMAAIGREASRRHAATGTHLWVFDANVPSREFYTAMGGEHVQRVVKAAPDGQDLPAWRVAWTTASALVRETTASATTPRPASARRSQQGSERPT
jgi:GNAT superfamily N-acetyltransferase